MQIFKIKNRKNLEIVGEISIPEKSIGLVFVLHGLGGFRQQNHIQTIAKTFFENNYTVVNFDATNSIGESEGKYEDATMRNHYEDLVDVVNWSKTQDWYKKPFVLAGHSLGGFAVAKYAEEYPQEVKAIFPYALVVSGKLSFEASKKFKINEITDWKKTGWATHQSASKPGTELRLPWSHMKERLKHDLQPNASKLTMPVLFVVGEKDESCPPEHQKILYDLVPGPKEFYVVSGAPHTFKEIEHLNKLKKILDSWIKKLVNLPG